MVIVEHDRKTSSSSSSEVKQQLQVILTHSRIFIRHCDIGQPKGILIAHVRQPDFELLSFTREPQTLPHQDHWLIHIAIHSATVLSLSMEHCINDFLALC